MNFNEWWSKYCMISSLNKINLSFLDIDILREEMKLAFYHELPEKEKAKMETTNNQFEDQLQKITGKLRELEITVQNIETTFNQFKERLQGVMTEASLHVPLR